MLDQERWTQVDVPLQIQNLVNACVRPVGLGVGAASGGWRAASTSAFNDDAGNSTKPHVVLDGNKYHVVGVLTALMPMIADYVTYVAQLPSLGADILQKLIDLLRLFNARSCHLVLGARAMNLAGLKTITAKHLALAAQCAAFVAALVPHLSATLKRLLPERQQVLLKEMDKLLADLNAHELEIYLKLVAIMKERLDY